MTIQANILRACAAYLVHAHVYDLDEAGALALLRAHARAPSPGPGVPGRPVARPAVARVPPTPLTDDECDDLIRAHVDAIRAFGTTRGTMGWPPGVESTARAILDATPAMMVWWCDKLWTEEGAP